MTVETAPASTSVGTVALTVADLERSREFYEQVLGMRVTDGADGAARLTSGGAGAPVPEPPLLALTESPAAAPLDHRRTGLYHFAVLVPTRRDLAVAISRVASARWPISGASDHMVSEALYLDDPDGIGIEIYHDRDRSLWRHDGAGQLQMTTLPMDIRGVLGELTTAPADPDADRWLPAGTRIGHVHLQIADLHEAERFYSGVLGLEVTTRDYPGALFVSAGGYHHHIGLNTWHSAGAGAPAPGAIGLHHYELRLPDPDALAWALARVRAAGIPLERSVGEGALVRDPSSNRVLLTA